MPDDVLNEFSTVLSELSWDESDEKASIKKLYAFTDELALENIGWYGNHAVGNRRAALVLRSLAIFFGGTGAIVQILGMVGNGTVDPSSLTNSYALFALAGVCVMIDRWLGVSSAWMRYTLTKATLERDLTEFRMAWPIEAAKLNSGGPIESAQQFLRDAAVRIQEEVREESEIWSKEYQSALAEIGKAVKVQAEATKSAAIIVEVDRKSAITGPLTLALDHRDVCELSGDKHLIQPVSPGPHFVAVRGTGEDGIPKTVSEAISLAPGAKIRVKLPI